MRLIILNKNITMHHLHTLPAETRRKRTETSNNLPTYTKFEFISPSIVISLHCINKNKKNKKKYSTHMNCKRTVTRSRSLCTHVIRNTLN